MTGAAIVGAWLRSDPAILALVDAAHIKAGQLPEDAALPALLVRTTSSVERLPLKRGSTIHTMDRVSVTVRAANYRDQVTLIDLVRRRCAGRTGDLGGGARGAILSAGTGPDVIGPGNSFEQTIDFRVSFDAPA